MGGLAIRPADHNTPMKSHRTLNFNHNTPRRRQTPGKGNPRKRNTAEAAAVAIEPPTAAARSKNLAMGQVKILKRGEALKETLKSTSEIDRKVSEVVPVTGGSVLPPPMTRECYAGYGFGDSPSPSLLPLPRFFINSCV